MKPSQGLLDSREELFQNTGPRTQIIKIQTRSTSVWGASVPWMNKLVSMSSTMSGTLVLQTMGTAQGHHSVRRQCLSDQPQPTLVICLLSSSEFLGYCLCHFIRVPDPPSPSFLNMPTASSFPQVPKWWILWYSNMKCTEFSKKSTASYNGLHHD